MAFETRQGVEPSVQRENVCSFDVAQYWALECCVQYPFILSRDGVEGDIAFASQFGPQFPVHCLAPLEACEFLFFRTGGRFPQTFEKHPSVKEGFQGSGPADLHRQWRASNY